MNKPTIKTKSQAKIMQESADLAVACMKYISNYLVKDASELSLARKIRKWFKDHGAQKVSFAPIVAFGKNAADPHHKPDTTKLTSKDVVVIDIGCVYKGWCSDITRTFLPLKPTKKQLEVYNVVLAANLAGIAKAKVGMKAYELDKICRDIIDKKGYGKYFIHTTGHGIGKVVHEEPRIGKIDQTVLTNNMFFTIEPGIYLPNEFGIRIEDTVCFANNKLKVLTKGISK